MSRRPVAPGAILMLVVGLTADLPAVAQPEVGGAAPGFELPALDGSTVSLGELSGQNVVIHFGAGW